MVNDKYVVKYLDPRTGKYEYATIKDVGDLQKLNTKVKTSIVDAINSISTDGIGGLRDDLNAIGETIKSLEDGTLELGDFQSIDDVVSREIEDAINSLKLENSGLLQLTQEEINKIVSNAESEYRDNIATSIRELETSKTDLVAAREKMITIGKMLENANIDYSNLTQVVDKINLYITDIIEKTDFDMVNGIVSDYKTAVTQTQDGWGVDASKNMLSYLTGRVKSNETSLNVQHGLIEAKVGKDEFQYMTVDNLPAGKENMLHNTFDLRDWGFSSAFIFKSADDYRFTSIVQADSAGENITGTTDELEQGVTYAISTYVNVQNKNKEPGQEKYAPTDGLYTATVIIDGDTIELNNVVEDNSALDGWKRVSGTFIAKRTAKQDIKFYVTAFNRDTQVGYLSAPKFEKGSSATSWVPHIEDNVSTMLSQNAVMRVLSDRITSSVEEVRETKDAFETATSTFDQMADGFELNTNKLTEVLDKYGEVTGVQTQQASELKVLNESITSKVWKQDINATIDTINIDTSNRIVNSAFNIYSYDEQTGKLKLDYWDSNTGFEIKKHSQSLDNYLYAKRSNAASVNPISIKSSPFALRNGEKILFNFEYLAVGNPLDNDNVFTLEMYDNNDVRVGLQEFRLSELKKEFLTAYDVGDSYKYNGTYIVKNSSVVKGTITLKLPKNGELWLTKVMLQNAGIGTIGWTPSSVDNQIIQSKLSTEINQLADSIELVATDERLDAISGLLVKKDGKVVISPEAIISRVTSQTLGENGLITQTSLKQTEDNLRFDLVDKDGIIQTINASADGLLIDFDKVQIDGELIARMISAQSIDATQGFRLTDNNGNTLLAVVNDDGKPTLSIAKDFNVKFKDFSNKLDVTVVNVVDEYYHSTDESKPVGGQWTSAPNDFRGDTFVWKRTKVVLQSGKEYYLPDENGINITSGWNYAKGEVTNAIEAAQEEVEKAVQSAQDADVRANEAIEKAGANANLLTTHQNTLNTIKNTTIPNINSSISDAMAEAQSALSSASSAMDEAKKADGKIADYVTKNGLVNGTTVDSKINDATGEINKKITTVESKIPTEIGGRNYFSLTNLNKIQPTNWVVRAYVYNFKLEPNTKYTLSSNVPSQNGDSSKTNIYFNGSGTSENGVWEGNSVTNTSDANGNLYVAIPTGRPYTQDILDGKYWVQLEKGTLKTDWSPAPEDNYTQEEFKIFESTYKEDVKGINSSLTDLSNKKLDGSTYTTFYNNEYKKTAQGVTDTYTKVNKIIDANGNSTDAFAKAVYDRNATRQSADFKNVTKDLVKTATYTSGINGINNSITTIQGKLENLESPNLVLDSNKLVENSNYLVASYNMTENLIGGETYTITVWGDFPNGLKVYHNGGGGANHIASTSMGNNFLPSVGNNKYEKTVTVYNGIPQSSTPTFLIYQGVNNTTNVKVRIDRVMITKGKYNLTYQPAPSDMLGKEDFKVFKNTYESNDQAIKNRLTAIDSGKQGSIAYNANTALSTAQGNTKSITSLNTKVDGLKIGGRNLISGTDDLTNIFGSGYGGSTIKYHKNYKVTSAEWGKDTNATRVVITKASGTSGVFTTTNDFKMIFGKPYTLSFYIKNLGQNRIQFNLNGLMLNPNGNGSQSIFVNGGESGKFSATGYARNNPEWNWFQILPAPAAGVTSMDFAIAYLQVEEGNFATDWTPALSDQMGKAEFTVFKNDYEETSKGILSRLTAIDSTKEGSFLTRLNKTEKTASGNSTLISTINKNYVTQKNINDSILSDKRIKDTRDKNEAPSYYYSNYQRQEVKEFKRVSVMGIGSGTYGILTTNVPWTDSSGGRVQQTFDTETEKFTRQGQSGWSAWVKQIDTADSTYQKITETSSLYERVIGSSSEASVKQNMARIVMTDSAFKTEVVEKMDINARIANGKPLAQDPNFEKGLEGLVIYNNSNNGNVIFQRMATTGTHASAPAKGYIFEIKSLGQAAPNRGGFRIVPKGGSDAWYEGGEYVLDMVAKLPVGASMGLNNNSLGTGGELKWLTDNKGTGQYKRYQAYAKLGAGHHSIPIFYVSIIHAGSDTRWYQFAKIEVLDINYSVGSSITQLSDNINLKVSKADLISQINVQAGGVLITSGTNKLNVTPTTTYIQNGTIKSAMIDTLSANQITGINTSFVQSSWNAINSRLSVTGSELKYTHSDGSYTRLNANGIQTVVGGSAYQHNYLTHIANVTINSGSAGNVQWVQLPSVFKGKKFEYFMGVTDIYGALGDDDYSRNKMVLKRFVLIKSPKYDIDYANARIPILGYAHYVNMDSRNDYFRALQGIVVAQY